MPDHTTRPEAASGRRHRSAPQRSVLHRSGAPRAAALLGGSLLLALGGSALPAQSPPLASAVRLTEAAAPDTGDALLADSLARLEERRAVASERVRDAAERATGKRVVVSLEARTLWYLDGTDTLYTAPVAIGKSAILEYGDRVWTFDTPVSIRTVRGRQENPVWVPPDWHYLEVAAQEQLEVEWLKPGRDVELSDGRKLVVRRNRVGLLTDGRFEALPLGDEIIFDDKLFIPPMGSANRRIPGELGRYKIDLGNGILLHGTPHQGSVGSAVTHGCLRLLEDDIAYLYEHLPRGTNVYIF